MPKPVRRIEPAKPVPKPKTKTKAELEEELATLRESLREFISQVATAPWDDLANAANVAGDDEAITDSLDDISYILSQPIAPVSPPKREPVWKGPEEDGITNSLLSRFLQCRHRFWLKTVEGLQPNEGFRHAIEFGQLWHEAEEAHAASKDWRGAVNAYALKLRGEYPGAEVEINKWHRVTLAAYPEYVAYWNKQPTIGKKVALLQEAAFKIPLQLPSGRWLTLRGKFDSVFGMKTGKKYEGYLQENKSKGTIDTQGLQQSVALNLQTMIYQTALRFLQEVAQGPENEVSRRSWFEASVGSLEIPHVKKLWDAFTKDNLQIVGTLYNVIRRPLSDQYAIKQKKKETEDQFFKRLGEQIKSKPDYYFHRWLIRLEQKDIDSFCKTSLFPVLEQLCDWWDSIQDNPFDPWTTKTYTAGNLAMSVRIPNPHHYQFPFGVEQGLTMAFRGGGRGDYFDYLTTTSRSGLERVETLFPELE